MFLELLVFSAVRVLYNLPIFSGLTENKSPLRTRDSTTVRTRAHPGAVISVVELVFRAVSILVSILDCFFGVDINDSVAAINVVSTFFYF